MLRRAVCYKLTDVPEVLTASTLGGGDLICVGNTMAHGSLQQLIKGFSAVLEPRLIALFTKACIGSYLK
jgi:hypothetical protein